MFACPAVGMSGLRFFGLTFDLFFLMYRYPVSVDMVVPRYGDHGLFCWDWFTALALALTLTLTMEVFAFGLVSVLEYSRVVVVSGLALAFLPSTLKKAQR